MPLSCEGVFGAGEGNRTLMTSLEDRWRGTARELGNRLSWLRGYEYL
jgi:hypothetical protein